MNLSTSYMGIALPHPLIVGASHLTDDLDMVKELVDAGAAALGLRSLFEEEITGEQMSGFFSSENHGDSFGEASSYAPDPDVASGPDEYLEHIRRVKKASGLPVVASVNCSHAGSWSFYAKLIQEAGADALELNMYHAASDSSKSAGEVEEQMVAIVRDVKKSVHMPVAVKLSPMFTAFGHFARQVDAAGADGFVLFNRPHRVDIDVVELEVVRSIGLSTSADLELRLKGMAMLAGRIKASLAVSGGIHTALDVVKSTMVGAHAIQMVSAILRNGPHHLRAVREELENWMDKNEWNSLQEMRGNMGFDRIPDPAAYEREMYRKVFR